MGFAEVCGRARVAFEKTLQSPFTAQPCLFYRYEIEEYRRGHRSSHWKTVKEGRAGIPFFLEDDTGTVLVDPTGADLDLSSDGTYYSGAANTAADVIQEFCTRMGVGSRNFLGFQKKMRYTESFVAPGDTIYVLGEVGDNPYVAEGTGVKNEADLMIHKGPSVPTYFISDRSEKEVLSHHRWTSLLQVWGGPVLNIGCLIYLVGRLGLLK